MRSPEDSGCEGPADTSLILITNAHDYLSFIIDYFKLYTTTLHHYSSLIITTPSYALLHYITTY